MEHLFLFSLLLILIEKLILLAFDINKCHRFFRRLLNFFDNLLLNPLFDLLILRALDGLQHHKDVVFAGWPRSEMLLEMLELSPSHHLVSLTLILSLLAFAGSMGRVELASGCVPFSDGWLVEAAVNGSPFVAFPVDGDSVLIDFSLIFAVVGFGGIFLLLLGFFRLLLTPLTVKQRVGLFFLVKQGLLGQPLLALLFFLRSFLSLLISPFFSTLP